MKLALVKGSTSVRLYIFIQNSSLTTGAGLTGLVFNTASLVAYYVRPGGTATAITLATQTVAGAYSSGGFVEVDATNMPGVYRFDPPDAVLATGVDSVVVMLKGATNMAPVLMEVALTSANLNNATTLGLTNLDAAVSTRSSHAAADVWAVATRRLSDGTNIALAKGVGVTGFTDIDAAGVRTAVGLAAANLDTQIAAVQADTDNIQTRIPAALTVDGNIKADALRWAGAATATDDVALATSPANFALFALDASGRVTVGSIIASVLNAISDDLLGRNVGGGSSVGRLVKHALFRLTNRVRIAAGVLTVYDTDDLTSAFTQNVTTTAGNPISELDTV